MTSAISSYISRRVGWPKGADGQTRSGVFRLSSVTLEVCEGDLLKESTDAIVNSTSSLLKFVGVLSKNILKHGGKGIEDECNKLVKKDGPVMHATISGSGKLACQNIIHLVSPSNENDWQKLVTIALDLAKINNLTSVALPAFGTGKKYHVPSRKMARMMYNGVKNFAAGGPGSVALVKIIIYEKSAVHEFVDEMNNQYGAASGGQSGNPQASSAPTRRAPTVPKKPPVVTVKIIGLSTAAIDSVKDKIDAYCDQITCKYTFDAPAAEEKIKQLTVKQVEQIFLLEGAYSHSVGIQVEQSDMINRIRVDGKTADVMQCVVAINGILDETQKVQEVKSKADILQKSVQWEFNTQNGFTPYASEINLLIEEAFVGSHSFCTWTEHGDNGDVDKYRIDFTKREETQLWSNTKVRIRRIDKTQGGTTPYPKTWEEMPDDSAMLYDVSSTSVEYKSVETHFKKTCTKNNIVKIQRIQNPSLYGPYMMMKKNMDTRNPSTVQNERYLFHATNADTLPKINLTGFNRSFAGNAAGCWYGKGVYFARDASYSLSYATADSNGQMYMYRIRVLAGEYTKGTKNQQAPQTKPNSAYPYDTLVNDEKNPQEFVVFHDNSAYPEYLITFS